MPRGRPSKKAAEVEIISPEEISQSMREVKHKTEWVELRPVEEEPEEAGEDFDDDSIEDRPRRKIKNAREELRKKLRAQGVSPSTNLRLYVEKYLHSDSNTGGSYAETEFCTKYETTEEHILNKDYIDVARRWGAGKYRITIRMQNKIVDAFDQRISATPAGPVIQQINPNDPTSPPIVIQTNGDGQQPPYQPMSMKDMMRAQREAFKEQLEMAKLMREAYGLGPEQQQQPKTEEEILSSAILKQPEVIENVVGSVIKRFGGAGGKDDEPWYADVVRDAVKSGQAAQIVQIAIDRIFNGFGSLFPGRQNNGQAPMVETPLQTSGTADSQRAPDGRDVVTQEITQGNQALQPANGETDREGGMLPAQSITPEQHALSRLIENCARRVPVQVAYQQLINYADAVNEQAPDYSIDGYIDLLGSMPTDQVIEFVKTLPNGEQVASLEWAKEWTAELQRLINENQEGDEE